jgi:glyoxylase-like metal-dependent hydrolase (beta-lactamase superfamily II)
MSPSTANRLLPIIAFATALAATPVIAQTERTVTRLADGVYAIRHRDAQDGFAGGNTTVVIGDRQVLVVDAPFLPSDAREDIADIRRWTDKPVTFLVTTHFHNDHNLGNRAYMDAFPALTIIAHAETKKDMDLFGPESAAREDRASAAYEQMQRSGKNGDGTLLTAADRKDLDAILVRRRQVTAELRDVAFQTATLTFEHDLTIDLGHRVVEIEFLGRGNTARDAVVYVPAEKLVVAGDLVVYPLPYVHDGYPSEWVVTLRRLAELDATAIVPGHGPVLRDTAYVQLLRELFASAVGQMNEALRKSGPAMFRSVDDVKTSIDLTPFRQRFAGNDKDLAAAFDRTAADLVRVVFREASLR